MYAFDVQPQELGERWIVPLYRARHLIADLANAGRLEVKPLGDLADVASGTYVPDYHSVGKLYLRVDNVREYLCNLNPTDVVRVREDGPGINNRVLLQDGDVLIARTGTLGKAALCRGPIDGAVLSQHLTRLTVQDNGRVAPGYLAAFLNSDLGKYQLLYSGFGSTRLELTHSALRAIQVPLPDAQLQQEIHASVVAAVDALYECAAGFSSAVSGMTELLGPGDEQPTGATSFAVAAERLGALWTPRYYHPAHTALVARLIADFNCKRLGDLATIQRGKGTRIADYATHGIPFIRTTGLINYGIDPFPDHYASDDLHELFQQPVKSGDILFSIEGKIGEVAYLTDEDVCVFKNHIEHVSCRDSYDPMYVFLCLASAVGRQQAHMLTVVQATLPGMASRLRDVIIPLEPRDPNQLEAFNSRRDGLVRLGYAAASKRSAAVSALRSASERIASVLQRAM